MGKVDIFLEKSKFSFERMRIHISGVTKCVTKFLTLSKSPNCDSVKMFVTPEIWTLGNFSGFQMSNIIDGQPFMRKLVAQKTLQ